MVLGITADGTKRILGVRQGATENASVCAAPLEDLVGRGLDAGRPTLFVLDGSKALHAAVTRVWGENAVIQGCQVHKKRNVKAHVPSRVTRWRDGDMRRRWCVAGLLRAEGKSRRVKGHRAVPALTKALEGSVRARPAGIEQGAA